jgi:hypothetical protein
MVTELVITTAQIAVKLNLKPQNLHKLQTYSLTTANNGRMMTTTDMVIMTPTKNPAISAGGFKGSHIEIV